MGDNDLSYMQEALQLARHGIEQRQGGPFGAVVVYDGAVTGRGWNQVVLRKDPTAHAEILAIRDACRRLDRLHLDGATLYTSCEPCPMCLSAAYWARIKTIVFAADAQDAEAIGFPDSLIKQQLQRPLKEGTLEVRQLMRDAALQLFQQWQRDPQKISY